MKRRGRDLAVSLAAFIEQAIFTVVVKNVHLVKVEGPLEAEAARLLRAVEGVEVVCPGGRGHRGVATVRFGGTARPVDIKLRRSLNAATAWQLVRQAEGAHEAHLLVLAGQATEEARDILRRHGIGLVDGAGNAHVELPGLLLHIEGKRRPKGKADQRRAQLSGKAGGIAQALLLNRQRAWRIRDLAAVAGASDALVHRVLARLEAVAIVASEGAGPARVRRVVNPTALLDLWAEENVDRAVERTAAFRVARTTQELVGALSQRLVEADVGHAFTGAAAAMALAPFVTAVPTVDVWIESGMTPMAVLELLGAERVETGANLVLRQAPGDGPLAFRYPRDGTWLVNRMRLYYDLRQDPRRGREQADRLRREVLGL